MKYFWGYITFCFLVGCQTFNNKLPDESRELIAFFGSSVCKNVGDEEGLGYAGRFARRLDTLKWRYVNVSKGGDNTIKITRRLDSLYLQHPAYVVVGLSLSNEGFTKPLTEEGRYRIFERFRTGLLRISDSIRAHGAIPVIANCYARNSFNESDYLMIRQINAIINEWTVPSINLLGAINDGHGRWVKGYEANDGHPNKFGHDEMSRTIVHTLFDALEAGKPVPYRNWTSDYMEFTGMQRDKQVLSVKVDSTVHSFAESIMFRTTGEGVISSVELKKGRCTIKLEKGKIIYQSEAGSTSVPLPDKGLESWGYLTLSHNYALGETRLFVNGVEAGPVKEKLEPQTFLLGGFPQNTGNVPDTLSLRDWMIHRSSLTSDEAKNYMKWKMLRSSLEVYAPLVDDSLGANSELENRAQSLTKVEMKVNTKFRIIQKGMKKDL